MNYGYALKYVFWTTASVQLYSMCIIILILTLCVCVDVLFLQAALRLLHMHGCQLHGNPLKSVVQALDSGMSPSSEPFLTKGLLALAQVTLRNLRQKTSIPVEKAAYLMGVMDEENILEEGQVGSTSRFLFKFVFVLLIKPCGSQ